MGAAKKRQTMAKQARERAVKERRALKLERKREAANLRHAGAAEGTPGPGEEQEPGVPPVPGPARAEEPSSEEIA
jgi:hypothetical protein